jgi:general secretion pathway protein G
MLASSTRADYRRGSALARGFTLIELLIVFTLVALLLTIAVPRYLGATETAREKVRLQNMATLRDALDKFNADQGRYPMALSELVDKSYLRAVPLDPVTGSSRWIPVPRQGASAPGIYDIAPPEPAAVPTQPTATASQP